MSIQLEEDAVITKSFNNNIILVKIKGSEKILFSKGIGFGKKFGDIVPKNTEIEKIFTIEDKENIKNLKNIINKVDSDFFAVCEEAIVDISKNIKCELNESIHISLIDHLFFAVKRLKSDEEIQNPFLVEIEILYNNEYRLAEIVAEKVGNFTGVIIPDGEIGFIALHIHSAMSNGKLSNTIKYSYLSNTIVEHIEDRLNIEIDRKSLDYARFLTHIRFAIERIIKGSKISNDFIEIIKLKYEKSYKIAEEVSVLLKDNLIFDVSDDEIAYLAMHIERFRISVEN